MKTGTLPLLLEIEKRSNLQEYNTQELSSIKVSAILNIKRYSDLDQYNFLKRVLIATQNLQVFLCIPEHSWVWIFRYFILK